MPRPTARQVAGFFIFLAGALFVYWSVTLPWDPPGVGPLPTSTTVERSSCRASSDPDACASYYDNLEDPGPGPGSW